MSWAGSVSPASSSYVPMSGGPVGVPESSTIFWSSAPLPRLNRPDHVVIALAVHDVEVVPGGRGDQRRDPVCGAPQDPEAGGQRSVDVVGDCAAAVDLDGRRPVEGEQVGRASGVDHASTPATKGGSLHVPGGLGPRYADRAVARGVLGADRVAVGHAAGRRGVGQGEVGGLADQGVRAGVAAAAWGAVNLVAQARARRRQDRSIRLAPIGCAIRPVATAMRTDRGW